MLSSRLFFLLVAALALPLAGCGDDSKPKPDDDAANDEGAASDEEATGETTDAAVRDASRMDATVPTENRDRTDAGASADAGADKDAGPSVDAASSIDAGQADASRADAAAPVDAGHEPKTDAGSKADAGLADAGDDLTPLPRGTCGTFRDIACPVGQYCDFSTAGGGDGCHIPGARGVCAPIPSGCDTAQALPVCTCDGALYWKPCLAILAGQTVDYGNVSCLIPPIML